MKVVLRFVLIAIGVITLMELNSNSLISDIKGFFHKSSGTFSSHSYTSNDTDKIPNDYLQILHLKKGCCRNTNTNELYLEHMANNILVGNISGFVYKKQYYLQISTLSDSFNSSLNNAVKQYNISSKHCYGYIESDDESAINYTHRTSPQQNITSIHLKLLGKNNRTIVKNDSVACYYSMFTTFSIQYNNYDATPAIYAETKGSNLFYTNLLPVEILFLKRNHKLYLLTMSVFIDGQDTKYPPGMLYNLIKDSYSNNN